jgi:hypothetical protein
MYFFLFARDSKARGRREVQAWGEVRILELLKGEHLDLVQHVS